MTAPTLLPRDGGNVESGAVAVAAAAAAAAAQPLTPSAVANSSREAHHQQVSSEDSHSVVRNSLIAGSVAGVAATLACHPFDVIRTKMQSASMGSTSAAAGSSTRRPPPATAGPLQVISQTLKNGGLRALYTGLALPLAAQAVYKATIFTVNNVTQETLVDWHNHQKSSTTNSRVIKDYSLTMSDYFICGFVAGGVNAALFVTPVEYVRNQLIRQHSLQVAGQKTSSVSPNFTGPLDVVRNTMRRSSPLGLWKGVGVTMARDAIGVAFFFGSMQWCQQYIAAKPQPQPSSPTNHQKPSLSVTMISGAVAGLAYWVVALPLDSVKTWVQSDMADSAVQAVKLSLQQQGLKQTLINLFAGFQVAYSRGIPSAAITVATYSLCYQALQDYDGKSKY